MDTSVDAKDNFTLWVHRMPEDVFYDFVIKNSLPISDLGGGTKSAHLNIGDNTLISMFTGGY